MFLRQERAIDDDVFARFGLVLGSVLVLFVVVHSIMQNTVISGAVYYDLSVNESGLP